MHGRDFACLLSPALCVSRARRRPSVNSRASVTLSRLFVALARRREFPAGLSYRNAPISTSCSAAAAAASSMSSRCTSLRSCVHFRFARPEQIGKFSLVSLFLYLSLSLSFPPSLSSSSLLSSLSSRIFRKHVFFSLFFSLDVVPPRRTRESEFN